VRAAGGVRRGGVLDDVGRRWGDGIATAWGGRRPRRGRGVLDAGECGGHLSTATWEFPSACAALGDPALSGANRVTFLRP